MRRLIALTVVLFLAASTAQAAELNVLVTTDKAEYVRGETVNWQIFCWDNAEETMGIALLAISLYEDDDQYLPAADTEMYSGLVYQLKDTVFGAVNQFTLNSAGTPEPTGGKLADINAAQLNQSVAVGDVGHDDGTAPFPLFAKGSFVLSSDAFLGLHMLTLEVRGANYWEDPMPDANAESVGFDSFNLTNAEFDVVPEPTTLLLTGLGLSALAAYRRRHR